jgi:cysteinyl-tRNA synthetase
MVTFTNTLARRAVPFEPLTPGRVTMYTCGPTVNNFAHIGNFRAITTFDLVKRWLRARGFAVTHVMNITDVDDKTIRGAQAEGVPLQTFTARFTTAFLEDCTALRIAPPDVLPRATEHIPQMIEAVRVMLDKGCAYCANDGSVYFSIERCSAYGRLSHLDTRELRHGARVANDEYDKEHVSDFALWKAWTPDDGDVKWPSPWGDGRPGWHLECSVMARQYLGDTIDIHMGGEDLVFPHHENEIAQSEALTGKPFARCWLHNAHLLVDGKKMSKSLGNFYTVRDILAKGWSGREVRYVLLSAHYRQPLNFTFEGLHAARGALQRLDAARAALTSYPAPAAGAAPRAEVTDAIAAADHAWGAALDDDLNVSPALAALFDLVHLANKWHTDGRLTPADAQAVLRWLAACDAVLAVQPDEQQVPAEALALLEERQQARAAKNWARADEIRKALAAHGFVVEDTPAGPRLKPLTPA